MKTRLLLGVCAITGVNTPAHAYTDWGKENGQDASLYTAASHKPLMVKTTEPLSLYTATAMTNIASSHSLTSHIMVNANFDADKPDNISANDHIIVSANKASIAKGNSKKPDDDDNNMVNTHNITNNNERTISTANKENDIEFSADRIDYDSKNEIIIATGNVIARNEEYTIFADTIKWNRKTGRIFAMGNVRSLSANGEVAISDDIELKDNLRDGVIENLFLILSDGSRIAARRGERRPDGSYELDYAAYSGCSINFEHACPRTPSWQIKAVKVYYSEAKNRVDYDRARLELFGAITIPLPGLSHAVGGQKRSGLLVPRVRISSNNGLEYEQSYFIDLASNQDLLLTGHIYSKVLPLISSHYRRFDTNGALQVKGFITRSSKIATRNLTLDSARTRDFRGYFEMNGRYYLGDGWSLDQSARVVSDRTFLRRYDISRDDRLRSTLSLRHFSENSLLRVSGWAFQTLRVNDPSNQVPFILPSIEYRQNFRNLPTIGGNLQLGLNTLVVERKAGQDTQRAVASARWDLHRYTKAGQVVQLTALARGDLYHSDDNGGNPITVYRGRQGWEGRGILASAAEISWPLIGKAFSGSHIFTPRVQVVAAPKLQNFSVPNEDSRAIDLEDTNLFALNRFPGYDRFEDRSRITYGFDWAYRQPHFDIKQNFGQSYRLSARRSLLPNGTGLSERTSDFVGRTEIRYKDRINLKLRYRLDKDNLAIRRNEADLTFGSRKNYVKIGYLRLNRNIDQQLEDLRDREELRAGGRVQIDKYWSAFGSAIIDMTNENEDPTSISDGFTPIRHRIGVEYDDGCLSLGITWRYDYEDTGDARQGSNILFRLRLRNVGGH